MRIIFFIFYLIEPEMGVKFNFIWFMAINMKKAFILKLALIGTFTV